MSNITFGSLTPSCFSPKKMPALISDILHYFPEMVVGTERAVEFIVATLHEHVLAVVWDINSNVCSSSGLENDYGSIPCHTH